MTEETIETPTLSSPCERFLGEIRGNGPGPTMLVLTGIHGNEPSGVRAAERVLEAVSARGIKGKGHVLFLAGNLAALSQNVRFVECDLNRAWTLERVSRIEREGRAHASHEAIEQLDLLKIFRRAVHDKTDEIYLIDLHTSSADGAPFVTAGDTLRNRQFARKFPLPLILGLEEQVDGSLLEFLNNKGLITMGVEGGRHACAKSIDRHEAVLWLALVHAGALQEDQVPDIARYRSVLECASEGIPRIVEVRSRHAIQQSDQFRMEKGFLNFQSVRKGQRLAQDHRGEVFASETGLILLPLYQGQGDDGFFLSREVKAFWLKVSAKLRRLSLGRFLHFLPGVSRDSQDPEILIVNTRIARIYPLEIFHLFGYRKRRKQGHVLMVSRRRHDLVRPSRIEL